MARSLTYPFVSKRVDFFYFSPRVQKTDTAEIAALGLQMAQLFVGASESISDLIEHFSMVRC